MSKMETRELRGGDKRKREDEVCPEQRLVCCYRLGAWRLKLHVNRLGLFPVSVTLFYDCCIRIQKLASYNTNTLRFAPIISPLVSLDPSCVVSLIWRSVSPRYNKTEFCPHNLLVCVTNRDLNLWFCTV